ncbi:CNNM domain-containing protein [Desulfonema magnum]|uniref:CNNM and CBS domains-containing protein n=1 Tax=Desulfonema magnum TaxID=45655 RepID=A0A975BIG3_9BACT|nr:hemolysin family protein [Desulfonema magnum]QTA86122.1 CNNM and CBS domains-containing protein [Desulfonema magnum]
MLLLILYVSIALIFSFFCSIAEAVLLSVTSPYIASLEQKGKRTGKLLRKLKDDVNRPLAAILTLNTIAHTFGAAGVGAEAAVIFGNEYIGVISAVMTLSILIFSEIIPKTLGASYWRQLAPVVATFLRYLVWILFPLVFLSQTLTKRLSKSSELKGFSREEFAAMADLGAREGQLAVKESRILKNLFRLSSTKIKSIMTPRTVVFALQQNISIDNFFEQHYQTPFSRIPIYNRDRDDITGFVLKDDILLAQARDMHNSQLHEFKRDIKAVPSTDSVSELFEFLLDRREHIVLVVDEYGGMEGIVTLEDVVETLLGLEIVDEADKTVDMQALARALWEKRARNIGLIADEVNQTSGGEAIKPVENAEISDERSEADAPAENTEISERNEPSENADVNQAIEK